MSATERHSQHLAVDVPSPRDHVVSLILGTSVPVGFGVATAAALGVFLALAAMTVRFYLRVQAALQVLFPTPPDGTRLAPDSQS